MAFMAGKPDNRPFIQVVLLGLYKITFGLYVKLKCNVSMVKNEAYRKTGSYILLANHVHNFDPVFIQHFWPRIICYVTNDTVWKLKWLRGLLDSVGFIPKKKMTTDSATVRGILTQIKKGRIIGIFPEGKRSWGGRTLPIIATTASLIKKLKLPVVTVKIEGAMMSGPRWAKAPRRGKIYLVPEVTLTANQIETMSADDVMAAIIEALAHDETAFLKAHPKLKYRSNAPAEYLELYLYACKDCGAMATMRSEKDRFFCQTCGSAYTFTREAELSQDKTGQTITLDEWDTAQKALTQKAMEAANVTPLFMDEDVDFYEYIRMEPLKHLGKGKLTMVSGTMRYEGDEGDVRVFPAEHVSGVNIQGNKQLEFTFGDQTFRFFFRPRVSPYKWQAALSIGKQQ